MLRFVLLTAFLGLLFYGGQRLWRRLAPHLAGQWRRIAVACGGLLLLVLLFTGRLGWLLAALGAAAAFLVRRLPQLMGWAPVLQRLWRQVRAFVRLRGGLSAVETAWLSLRLDRAGGGIDGTVRAGRFAGRPLRHLNLDQLLALFRELQSADAPSAALLESYLDGRYGGEWRRMAASSQQQSRSKPAAPGGTMSRDEARRVLGLGNGAAPKDIVAAHRRLMQKFHPDRGGSDFLAAKINLAKDVLLKK